MAEMLQQRGRHARARAAGSGMWQHQKPSGSKVKKPGLRGRMWRKRAAEAHSRSQGCVLGRGRSAAAARPGSLRSTPGWGGPAAATRRPASVGARQDAAEAKRQRGHRKRGLWGRMWQKRSGNDKPRGHGVFVVVRRRHLQMCRLPCLGLFSRCLPGLALATNCASARNLIPTPPNNLLVAPSALPEVRPNIRAACVPENNLDRGYLLADLVALSCDMLGIAYRQGNALAASGGSKTKYQNLRKSSLTLLGACAHEHLGANQQTCHLGEGF